MTPEENPRQKIDAMLTASGLQTKAQIDAPAASRERDHLNRWPFAQEIYGIATTGPTDWSVRVGIYGEWGTGKTSVLEFIEGIAKAGGHIALRFNPWEFSDSRALWHAFVIALEAELKKHAPTWNSYNWRQLKKPGWSVANFFTWRGEKIKATIDDQRVTLPLLGIDLLKDFCAYTRKDLQNLLTTAQGRRVLILIDDLDRTSATVVPEILFALKEVMDIPGVAFICAFDPEVVGEVLRERHPGFGDGLRFLEKIIEYPRWLPVPTPEGLVNLAVADAMESCPYVPEAALRDAVPLLPANPRAVRQFIRMLSLLRLQIERHYQHELRWPPILAANVLKVRHPRLAHPLLSDDSFWETIQMTGLVGSEKAQELSDTITKHVDKVIASQRVELETKDREQVEAAMKALCSQISMWSGFDASSLGYQMNLAEAPHAVTWKEFDALLILWREKPTVETADAWMGEHAKKVGRLYLDVYRETFDATLRCYTQTLRSAENLVVEAERPAEFAKAESVFALLECLALHLGRVGESDKCLDPVRFGELLKEFASLVNRSSPTYQTLREREAALVTALVRMWAPDIAPLIRVFQPFFPSLRHDMDSPAAKLLHKQLCAEALPRFAKQVVERFREADFVNRILHNREEGYEIIHVLLKVDGPLWKESRQEALAFFRDEARTPAVRENVFELFRWMDHKIEKEGQFEDTAALKTLLKDAEIVAALWNALTSTPLSPRPVAWLKDFPKCLEALGSPVILPVWWNETLASLGLPKATASSES